MSGFFFYPAPPTYIYIGSRNHESKRKEISGPVSHGVTSVNTPPGSAAAPVPSAVSFVPPRRRPYKKKKKPSARPDDKQKKKKETDKKYFTNNIGASTHPGGRFDVNFTRIITTK